MPTTRYYSEAYNGFGSDRKAIDQRLTEIDIQRPYIELESGTKRSAVDHTDPSNQYHIDAISGSYGVMPVRNLAILDIDSDPPESVVRLIEENPTLTVETPHGGRHYYYSIDGATNTAEEWGELRASAWYVVGPGSSIDHTECNDCDLSGETSYRIVEDRPIAIVSIDGTPFDRSEPRVNEVETGFDGSESTGMADFDWIDRRISKAKSSKHGDRFAMLYEGRYSDAGYNDRSNAEAELVERLAFWFKRDRDDVTEAMNRACRQYPNADVNGVRKWLERPDGYRDRTMKFVDQVDNVYVESMSKPGFRPTFSAITGNNVLEALCDLGLASTEEIAAHPSVDRSERQVRRVLKSNCETGAFERIRDGRSIRYYAFGGSFLTEEQRRSVGLD